MLPEVPVLIGMAFAQIFCTP